MLKMAAVQFRDHQGQNVDLSFTGLATNLCNSDFFFFFTFSEHVSYSVMFLNL